MVHAYTADSLKRFPTWLSNMYPVTIYLPVRFRFAILFALKMFLTFYKLNN